MINIIGHKNIFLGVSTLLVIISGVFVGIFGITQGIDFTGGTLWNISFTSDDISNRKISEFFKDSYELPVAISTGREDGSIFIRTRPLSEADHQEYLSALTEGFGSVTELSFQSIGPSIGEKLRKNALIAIGAVLFGISLYVAFVFRKASYYIPSWKYGATALITLFHDVSIPVGILSLLGAYYTNVEFNTSIVVALLVIAGFSIHDTIVVFDRIRENSQREGEDAPEGERLSHIINKSVNETLARSINTSLTLIFILAALLFYGPPTLFYFTLTILIGVTLGTYSSICVASPLLFVWQQRAMKRAQPVHKND